MKFFCNLFVASATILCLAQGGRSATQEKGYFDVKIDYILREEKITNTVYISCVWDEGYYDASEARKADGSDKKSEVKTTEYRFSFQKENSGYRVTFSDSPALGTIMSPSTGIGAGPCLSLGILPKDCKLVSQNGSTSVYTRGQAKYTVTKDLLSNTSSKIVVTTLKDEPVFSKIFEGKTESRSGQSIPAKVTSLLGGGDNIVTTFSSGELGYVPPDRSKRFEWYAPGNRIFDERVKPSAVFTYNQLVTLSGKKTGLTPAELLLLSQKYSLQEAKRVQKDIVLTQQMQSESNRSILVVVGVGVLVFVASLGFFFAKSRFKS